MGAQNVAKVFVHWPHLGHREARLLLYMANVSLDADKPPVYFGGWEAAARALGLDPAAKKASAKEAFRQATAALRKAGAIVSSGAARIGSRAEYALALDPNETFVPRVIEQDSGRPIVEWALVARIRRDNDSLPQQGQRNIAPPTNDSLPQVGQRSIGSRDNDSLPPRSTEEPHLGKPLGTTGGDALKSPEAKIAIGDRRREEPQLTEEQERNRQLAALRERMAREQAS